MNGYSNGPALMLPAASPLMKSTSTETDPTVMQSNAKTEHYSKEFLRKQPEGSQRVAFNTMCPPQPLPGYGIGKVNPKRRVIFPVLHGKSSNMTRIPCTLEQHRNGGVSVGQVTGGGATLGESFSRRMAEKSNALATTKSATQRSSILNKQKDQKPAERVLKERHSSLMPALERVSSASLSSTESFQSRPEPLKTEKKSLDTVEDESGQDSGEASQCEPVDNENPFLKFAFGLIQSLAPGNKSQQKSCDKEEPELQVRKCKSLGSISESAAEATALNVGKTIDSAVANNNIDATKGSTKLAKPGFPKRSQSEPVFQEKDRAVSFDPRVFVVEFSDGLKSADKWYTPQELCRFQHEAIALAVKRRRQQKASLALSSWRNGGGGAVAGALLALEDDEEEQMGRVVGLDKDDEIIKRKLTEEIRSVLIVDPHDIFCTLLTKAIRKLLPHDVHIVTAHSSEEAIQRIEAAKLLFPAKKGGAHFGFDLVVAEERLPPMSEAALSGSSATHGSSPRDASSKASAESSSTMPPAQSPKEADRWPSSGSGLIRMISEEGSKCRKKEMENGNKTFRASFLVGITAHPGKDRARFMQNGADMVWGKPPPPMDWKLRCEILNRMLKKRGEACLQ